MAGMGERRRGAVFYKFMGVAKKYFLFCISVAGVLYINDFEGDFNLYKGKFYVYTNCS